MAMKQSAFSQELVERLEDDSQFLEHYLLNDTKGMSDFTANSTVTVVEELFGLFPEELTPLVIALRKVRAKVIAKG